MCTLMPGKRCDGPGVEDTRINDPERIGMRTEAGDGNSERKGVRIQILFHSCPHSTGG
jgi:hypothetical protein